MSAGQHRVRVVSLRGSSWLSTALDEDQARELRATTLAAVEACGDTAQLIDFPAVEGPAAIRGREVLSVEPVPPPTIRPAPAGPAPVHHIGPQLTVTGGPGVSAAPSGTEFLRRVAGVPAVPRPQIGARP